MNKKENQKEIELEEKYRILCKALDDGFKGVISDVKPITSNDYYKNTTYDNRNGYVVTVRLQSDKGEVFTQFFSFPDVRGVHKSNLYAFEKKYKCTPKTGLEVEVCLNDDGFFRIVI